MDPEALARLTKETVDEEETISKLCEQYGRRMLQVSTS